MRPLSDKPTGRRTVVKVVATVGLPHIDRVDVFLQLVIEGVHNLRPDVYPGQLLVVHAFQLAHDVFTLALQHEQNTALIGIRTVQHEQIWKACRAHPEVGLGAVTPGFFEGQAIAAGYIKRCQVGGGLKTG